MSDFYNNFYQKSTEDIYQYAIRLKGLWREQGKSAHKRSFFLTEKFFILTFISGLYDEHVRRKMKKWYNEEQNPEMLSHIGRAISRADDYQDEEDGTILVPIDNRDVDENNNYE